MKCLSLETRACAYFIKFACGGGWRTNTIKVPVCKWCSLIIGWHFLIKNCVNSEKADKVSLHFSSRTVGGDRSISIRSSLGNRKTNSELTILFCLCITMIYYDVNDVFLHKATIFWINGLRQSFGLTWGFSVTAC